MTFDERTERRINKLRRELAEAVKRRRRKRRPARTSNRPKGRPGVDPTILAMAKELAKDAPIADVAMRLNIGVSTLYDHGISRKALKREAMISTAA